MARDERPARARLVAAARTAAANPAGAETPGATLALAPALEANRLGALWATVGQAMDQALAEHSPASAAILLWLQHWAPTGVVELARVVGLSQPACTRAIDRLVDQGWVLREALSGKAVRLTLSRRGQAQARELQRRRLGACGALLQALSPAEQAQFAGLVNKLLQAPVADRAYARHVCRFCDHAVCDGPACPIGCRATALEQAAGGAKGAVPTPDAV